MSVETGRSGTETKGKRAKIWYDWKPDAEKDRASVIGFLHWRFPDLAEIEELRREQKMELEHLEPLELAGHSSEVISGMRRRVNESRSCCTPRYLTQSRASP